AGGRRGEGEVPMIEADTFDAFATAVGTFAAQLSPALPVAWPGINFTPPDTGEWLEVSVFPNGTENYGMANDAPVEHMGILQVGCCARTGSGVVSVLELAGA